MKAIVCNEYAPIEKLAYTDVPDPEVGPSDVLVDIKAAGVNYPDGLIVQGLYQVKPELPFSPGFEFAGVISQVGEKVKGLEPGTRIMGMTPSYGAYAEKIAVNKMFVLPIPDEMTFVDAANLACAHGTAHHALKQRGQVKPGETLLVLGAAGGTGVAAVQIGKAMGATVIAACSSQEKLDIAKENGADILINYNEQDLRKTLKEVTEGKGVDVVYDPVGGDAFDACTRSMARNGRILVIGFASGTIPKLPVNLTLVKEYSVTGVFWGNFTAAEPQVYAENLKEMFQWYKDGQIKVITEAELPLSEAPKALNMLLQRQVKGKLVLLP